MKNQNIDFKLWLTFLFLILIPALLNMVRLHFIGTMPNEWGFNIASQIQWLNITYEVFQEGLLIPLFFVLAQAKKQGNTALNNNVSLGFGIVFVIYGVLSTLIFLFAENILHFANQKKELIEQTATYIRLESVAIMCSIFVDYLLVYLAVTHQIKKMIKLSVLKISLLLLMDIFLVANHHFSLKMGVNGIAISNIVVYTLLTVFVLFHSEISNYIRHSKIQFNCEWLKSWFKLGAFSGIESLIRNMVFGLMILGMINQIGEQGSYWVANSIIWGILLAPALALSELVKRDVAEDANNIIYKTKSYLKMTLIFCLLWIISMPLWSPFIQNILQVKEYEIVLNIMYLQTFFYIVFMFDYGVFDATLKGLGLTRYMLYQSILIDIVYYGIVFVLYKMSFIIMSIQSISLIFGIGMTLSILPTLYLYIRALKQRNISIKQLF